ncbi:phosphoribosyltransferase [Campylobacter sp. VicNov18]|uniref:phosphoribosyltransferase n=1 Tax=Campylobacter bilis TaxID=2691918 RepID=UPI00130E896C|nr:phosphoribosyltransferase [Campylobacter bilis]MPV64105.1 phosphoribosyltransferase [Campylobacter hepaticus]MBM0637608.1 phosphoribosyltransferase [Campylobacter bilis]MCC8278334.1 phosphoribosyltransferase [Campylobacter bilis]MCC8299837.1 phosphoribosyltransferase [Campylobacter bilis]MCC8301243.1 phosphoribosyltransferase [Campylobacter bilis]
MIFYSYDEFKEDVKILAKQINKDFKPEVLLAIARGGMSLGHSLAVTLKIRQLFSLNSIHYDHTQKRDTVEIFNIPDLSKYKKILLIDDIVDSGESLAEIKKVLLEKFPHIELKIATLFYKKNALLQPEFKLREATAWVDFYWDISID